VGPSDRAKIREYLELCATSSGAYRRRTAERDDATTVEQPAGVPATFEEHAKLMYDLQVLAYQCDLTRVITFMIGREFSAVL